MPGKGMPLVSKAEELEPSVPSLISAPVKDVGTNELNDIIKTVIPQTIEPPTLFHFAGSVTCERMAD